MTATAPDAEKDDEERSEALSRLRALREMALKKLNAEDSDSCSSDSESESDSDDDLVKKSADSKSVVASAAAEVVDEQPMQVDTSLQIAKAAATAATKGKAKEQPKNGDVEQSAVVCLICRSHLTDYIVLPACKMPHTYCLPCAKKLMTQPAQSTSWSHRKPRTPSSTIRCAFCQATSAFDATRGLMAFRKRTSKRVFDFSDGNCTQHRNFMLLYFCEDCTEPICIKCTSEAHKSHRQETLDSAYVKYKEELQTSMNRLTTKKEKMKSYVADIDRATDRIRQMTELRQEELITQMAQLQAEFDQKCAQIQQQVKSVEAIKQASLASELKWANEKGRLIDEGLNTCEKALAIAMAGTSPLSFFECLITNEEIFNEAHSIPEKTLTEMQQVMPNLPFTKFIGMLKHLQYTDKPSYYTGGMQFIPMDDGDDDDSAEY